MDRIGIYSLGLSGFALPNVSGGIGFRHTAKPHLIFHKPQNTGYREANRSHILLNNYRILYEYSQFLEK
jgi:hypothetical protein